MKAYGMIAQIEKGGHYASDDIYIKNCRLNNGKHRHQCVRRHKRIYNHIERSRSKAILNKELQNWR